MIALRLWLTVSRRARRAAAYTLRLLLGRVACYLIHHDPVEQGSYCGGRVYGKWTIIKIHRVTCRTCNLTLHSSQYQVQTARGGFLAQPDRSLDG